LREYWRWFWIRVKDIVRPRLQKLTCAIFGHIPIGRMGLWYVQRQFLPDDVEALCIRCGHRYCFSHDMAEDFFAESPLYKALQSHRVQFPNREENKKT
jgi:hypothetical protein